MNRRTVQGEEPSGWQVKRATQRPYGDMALNGLDRDSPLRSMFVNVRPPHFKETIAAKAFRVEDIAGGREYMKTYVEFIHYVERLYEAMTTSALGHFDETERGSSR